MDYGKIYFNFCALWHLGSSFQKWSTPKEVQEYLGVGRETMLQRNGFLREAAAYIIVNRNRGG